MDADQQNALSAWMRTRASTLTVGPPPSDAMYRAGARSRRRSRLSAASLALVAFAGVVAVTALTVPSATTRVRVDAPIPAADPTSTQRYTVNAVLEQLQDGEVLACFPGMRAGMEQACPGVRVERLNAAAHFGAAGRPGFSGPEQLTGTWDGSVFHLLSSPTAAAAVTSIPTMSAGSRSPVPTCAIAARLTGSQAATLQNVAAMEPDAAGSAVDPTTGAVTLWFAGGNLESDSLALPRNDKGGYCVQAATYSSSSLKMVLEQAVGDVALQPLVGTASVHPGGEGFVDVPVVVVTPSLASYVLNRWHGEVRLLTWLGPVAR